MNSKLVIGRLADHIAFDLLCRTAYFEHDGIQRDRVAGVLTDNDNRIAVQQAAELAAQPVGAEYAGRTVGINIDAVIR